MKFSEKLQTLRKENKLSQEELANMLDVSRQAVSKWESGQTYPEMDKLITMCKIFKCSMDDLTNDEIKDVNRLAKNKNTTSNIINEFFDIIDKSLKMFKSLPFKQVITSLMGIFIIFLFILLLHIPVSYIYNLGANVLYHLRGSNILISIWSFILEIAYLLVAIVLFIYIYKTRYLDNFDDNEYIEEKNIDNNTKINEDKEINKKKIVKEKVKKDNNNFVIFSLLGTIFIFLSKVMLFIIGCPFILLLFCLFICLILLIGLLFNGVLYFGPLFILVAAMFLNVLIIEIIYDILVNKNLAIKRTFIILILSIAGLGIGTGITMFDITNTNYIDSAPRNVRQDILKEEFNMSDDLFIHMDWYNIEIVKDEKFTNTVAIEVIYYPEYKEPVITKNYDNIIYIYSNDKIKFFDSKLLNIIIRDLRKKQLHNYTKLDEFTIKITTSEENINELNRRYAEYIERQTEIQRQEEIDRLTNLVYEYSNRIYQLEEQIIELENRSNDIDTTYYDELNECKMMLQEYKNRINEILNIN